MKILIISNYKDAINSVRPEGEIFIRLQKLEFDITIMTDANSEYIPIFKKAGIQIIDFHPRKKFSRSAIEVIRKELIKGGYDLLHLFNSKAITNGCFAAIGLPVKVLTYRGVIGGSHWLNPNAYLKHLHPRVDGITAVSKSIQTYLQKQTWSNRPKVMQFYKGQNLDWFKDVKVADLLEFEIPQNSITITCIANNRRSKGIRHLLKASYFLPTNLPIHFLLIGRKIANRAHLKLIHKSPNKSKIHLAGFRTDALELIAASQVYIQPSDKNGEGLGKAILEAMSMKIPPIVTNSGGPPEFVADGESGLIVPTANPKAIAIAIMRMYNNPILRKSLGNNAPEVIRQKMSIQNAVVQLKKIYEDFMD